uniref:Uncharacterized protein n=1 Tax=Riptortus pedestris TaxID=329032 RepID=R4WI67_RIPPE|nr:unknown secreted protein [Riptortus pedestris]
MNRVCLLFAVALQCVAAISDDDGFVEKVVSVVNEDLIQRKINEIYLPDTTYNYFVLSGQTKNAVLGDLPTLYVDGDNQVLNRMESKTNSTIFFDFHLGIKNFHLSYDFNYKFLHFFSGAGKSLVSTSDNKVHLAGRVTLYPSRVCVATLTTATVNDLGKYKVSISPEYTFHSFFSYTIEFFKNHLSSSDITSFNNMISEKIGTESFKSTFSDIACHSLGY